MLQVYFIALNKIKFNLLNENRGNDENCYDLNLSKTTGFIISLAEKENKDLCDEIEDWHNSFYCKEIINKNFVSTCEIIK